jgi:hypothetical protein
MKSMVFLIVWMISLGFSMSVLSLKLSLGFASPIFGPIEYLIIE